MTGKSRRAVLVALGAAGLGAGVVYSALNMDSSSEGEKASAMRTETTTPTRTETPTATATTTPKPSTWRLNLLGHSLLSSSVGGFAEGSIRADGRYAAVGTRFSGTGSYLVDLRDLRAPEAVHHLPADGGAGICMGVKVGPQKGLYCRTTHPAGENGIEIVDYGFAEGTPHSPVIIGVLDTGPTHHAF